jgi:ABC-2 type transport system ATP-binding protein
MLISCESVGIQYGDFRALAEFDLEVREGEAAVLVGPNGAGKSSLLKVLSGFEVEAAGKVRVMGEHPGTAKREWRRWIGVLPEHLGLFDALTVEEHLRLSAALYEVGGTGERVRELLGLLGLEAGRGRYAAACSYGMRKKTALALALLHGPKVLILDEPFEGLDPASCETVLALLRMLKQRGVGMIVSSHMLLHVERLADEVVLLDQGKVVWRKREVKAGELRDHYLDVVKAQALPDLEWF